jgi:hypothetical protein
MRKLLFILTVLGCLAAVAHQRGVFRDEVTLAWDYRTNNLPSTVFFVYGSETLTEPTNWPVITVVTGQTWATFQTVPASWFFAVTASNWWGESDFSNVLEIPEPPSSDINLRLE